MNWADFHFLRPLWFLAAIPALLFFFNLVRRRQQIGNWATVCDAALLPYLLEHKAGTVNRWPLTLGSIGVFLSILALAGPTWERLPSPVFRNDAALVIALDLSTSMDAADIKPSRLIRARYKITDLLKQRKDGQTALIVYAGDAFTVTPLTNDKETIENQLSALTTDIMPSQGNNTLLALKKAADLFQQAGLQKGQILLITDAIDADKTLSVIEKLSNYTVSILAVGTPEGAPIKAAEGDFVKDAKGSIVIPKLNSAELETLAEAGRGILVNLSDDNSDVEQLSRFFEPDMSQQGAENSNLLLQQWADQGPWLVILVLPLAALFFRRGLLGLVLLFCLPFPHESYAFEWRDLWLTKDQQAQQAFQNQDFKTAAEQFQNPEWQAAANYKAGNYPKALEALKDRQSADSFYNRGNALAQSGQLPEAIKAYEQALKIKPDDADTKFNKELVEKELKKQEQDKQQNQQQDQQNQDNKDKEQQKDQDSKSSDQKQQDQNSEQKQDSEPKNSDQQNKPENDEQNQDSKPKDEKQDQQQADQQEQKPDPKKAEQQAAEQAKQEQDNKEPKDPKEAGAMTSQEKPETEATQANEQWLKRIPDDPAGLLKRKFKYQYSQRQQQ